MANNYFKNIEGVDSSPNLPINAFSKSSQLVIELISKLKYHVEALFLKV
jgi:hypothetical protein